MDNAFFNVNIGGWKYGIWGLCPSEILHQFYEGLISYSLEFFPINTYREKSKQSQYWDTKNNICMQKPI